VTVAAAAAAAARACVGLAAVSEKQRPGENSSLGRGELSARPRERKADARHA